MGIAVIDNGKVVRTFTPADGLPGNDVRSLVRARCKHPLKLSERRDTGSRVGPRRQHLKYCLKRTGKRFKARKENRSVELASAMCLINELKSVLLGCFL